MLLTYYIQYKDKGTLFVGLNRVPFYLLLYE